MAIIAFGRCATCYRRKRGIDRRRGVCVDCHRYMAIAHASLCWTCYDHRRHPDRRRYKSRAFAGWTAMFDNPGTGVTRLSRDDRAALADIEQMIRGGTRA